MPSLRSATPADIPAVLRLIRALATYEKLLPEVEATEERLRATLFPAEGNPVARCVLAFADADNGDASPAEPVGFAVYFLNYSTFLAKPGLYLEDLFVEPAHRGRGIGKALLLHLAHEANTRGCGRMEWAVLHWNKPAIAFYESLGARPMQDWQVYRLTGDALAQHA